MNDLTIHSESQCNASSEQSKLAAELAKMFSLVAPVTMSADQTTAWLASAVDSLQDFRAAEVAEVSLEVRRSVTRPAQIVPRIAELVTESRAWLAKVSKQEAEARELMALPPIRKHIADRDRRTFGPSDWAELNEYLERMGSNVRYSSTGKKLAA